jgi:hypothetical protein
MEWYMAMTAGGSSQLLRAASGFREAALAAVRWAISKPGASNQQEVDAAEIWPDLTIRLSWRDTLVANATVILYRATALLYANFDAVRFRQPLSYDPPPQIDTTDRSSCSPTSVTI